MQGGGFEPPKAEPAGLQPAPFGHSGIPARAGNCSLGGHNHPGERPGRMTRIPRYSTAALLAASLLPAAAGARPAASGAPEPPLAVIVAAGAEATHAVLADGTWDVELPWLLPGDADPAVAPDGRRVAFVSARDGNEEIYVADTRTGKVRRLTHTAGAADRGPAWSPGGRRIVWESGQPGAADLHVMRCRRHAQGGARRRSRRRHRSGVVARRSSHRVLVEPRRAAPALGGCRDRR